MEKPERSYIAIDLKSFYASVECVDRNLDPLTTNLVVADESRTEKTICLAVSPSLKAYGIPGRPRLFEVAARMKEVNAGRLLQAPNGQFSGGSVDAGELAAHSELSAEYLVAVPRMSHYIRYSTEIYKIYLRYVSKEDIHVYSIDEVFMDVTGYLEMQHMTPKEFAGKMIREVLAETGITATAGIGTNLYLCKVAMDIVAKHIPADENGVRIAQLDEKSYRRLLWDHRPLTDFWRIGRGYQRKLAENGLFTMGDIARCSIGSGDSYYNEELLYKLFGVNAELLIDHAWGYEPCTIADIKAYKPQNNCLSSGQVLMEAYDFEKAKIIVREMAELLVLDLVDKKLVTDQIVLTVGYDSENLTDPEKRKNYRGEVTTDHYGREVPKHAHGTVNLGGMTSSAKCIVDKTLSLFSDIVKPEMTIRRINITANHVMVEAEAEKKEPAYEQMDLFTDYEELEVRKKEEKEELEKERKMQKAVLDIKKKFGKNALFKGTDLKDGATGLARNEQIGGHRA